MNRNYIFLIGDMLKSLSMRPQKKTWLLYGSCFLAWSSGAKYLDLMIRSELIIKNNAYYYITEKGIRYIRQLEGLKEMLLPVQETEFKELT